MDLLRMFEAVEGMGEVHPLAKLDMTYVAKHVQDL